ncbi:hypothetical protein ACFQ0M_34970 [Kitasatospora aburaviensis]
MVLFTCIYYINPTQRIIWWTGIGLGSVAAIVVGVHLNRPAHALPWYLLALANLSFTAGEVVQVIQMQFLHLGSPSPPSPTASTWPSTCCTRQACWPSSAGGRRIRTGPECSTRSSSPWAWPCWPGST